MATSEPVPMILHCPECHKRHIDEGPFATRPHHTHACQHCGFVWRPAIVNTVGVQYLPGFKNELPDGRSSSVAAIEWHRDATGVSEKCSVCGVKSHEGRLHRALTRAESDEADARKTVLKDQLPVVEAGVVYVASMSGVYLR